MTGFPPLPISAPAGQTGPGLPEGALANRPAAASASGGFYYATDTDTLYFSNGAAWTAVAGAGAAVTSVFTRAGAVVAAAGDYTAAQVTNALDKSAATQTVAGDIISAGNPVGRFADAVGNSQIIAGAANTGGGTNDCGFYSRGGAAWLRFSANAAPIQFYCRDADGINGGGGTRDFSVNNNGHLYTQSATAPTVAIGAAGQGVPTIAGSDSEGVITAQIAAVAAAGTLVTVTFGVAYTAAPDGVVLTVQGATHGFVQCGATTVNGFTVVVPLAADVTSGTVYKIAYKLVTHGA